MARILVVDDEVEIRTLLRKILTRRGHEVIEAENGSSAIAIVGNGEDLDVVITDIFMPDVDGIEVLRRLKANYPDLKIVVISGGGNRVADGYLPAATALGADHVIEKPFDPTEVGEQIENLLPPQP
jgi:two-component system chemotaxis response regulator CheY